MRAILLFLLTAALTTIALARLLPPVATRQAALKLAAFAERKDEWDVLILGSSQTHHGVDPAVFDACTAELGLETRSFNFGLPESGVAEVHGHVRRIAELQPARLRWILVEGERVVRVGGVAGDDGAALTRATIALADPETTALLWPHLGELEPRAWRLLRARWSTLVPAAYRLAGVGRALPLVEAALGIGPSSEERLECLGPRSDGYVRMEDLGMEDITTRPHRFQIKRRQLTRRAWDLVRGDVALMPARPGAVPFYERIQELGRELGARVIFYTLRGGLGASDATALGRVGAIELLHFDEPLRHPEVYKVEFTFDGGHFNREGALAFTRYLAEAFVERVGRDPR